jgi:hypothetical protein
VGRPQVGQSRCALYAERGPRCVAQFGAGEGGSVIGEADQASVEGGIPQRGEKQAVVYVEALRVIALGPGDDI